VTDIARRHRGEFPQAAGAVLLVSIVPWWIALRAWAEAQVGHLDVDALGVGPFAWTALLLGAGLALVSRALPRRADIAANVVSTGFFLVVTAALTAVNLTYGAHDGISAAGWLVAAFSLAQALLFVAAMLLGPRAPLR
jgi:hypothetical protein